MQRILVVDDDAAVTSLLRRGLTYEGFAVDTAGSGEAGLALAREQPPDRRDVLNFRFRLCSDVVDGVLLLVRLAS